MSDASPRFPGVLGHAHAQARLSRAIARDQLHHGLIFMGPRGIGKATLAHGLACALHCPVAPAVGCGTCTTCHRILTHVHAGVEWIVPEADGSKIKVETARELSTRLQHAPFEGRHHVVVLDPADALTDQAYNALLKAIEEPKPGVHLVMITSHAEGLLPTIRSRCLPVRLGPLPLPLVAQLLDDVLARRAAQAEATAAAAEAAAAPARRKGKAEPAEPAEPAVAAPTADPARRELAVRLSQGSVGQALELLADASLTDVMMVVRCAMEATRQGPAGIFGGDRGPLWSAWSQATGGAGPGRPARERAACARAIELWLLHLREHLRGGNGLPGLPAAHGDVPALLHQLDRLQALQDGLLRNPNVRLALEQTLLELPS
jgi:DNA polymerase III subunit delta'